MLMCIVVYHFLEGPNVCEGGMIGDENKLGTASPPQIITRL